eukprot:CAMPEP_0172552330 /NCGR_PEP_ID=MMETSP1067-20121228/44250_1 /TAXON_ID=265564 ORGANISM="Thalassiosira punctigera, Strain Tpunct2005C2" /NCGR_SAMPLE_ID=MMETSP1067 /ASSEMBLY_ACC=CAM_ASM_000444 /LENGTH=478 /DNA_ID=CAMNT_0013340287 /DNA_START=169 /DNA_END=1605 /DNA_ORIENTATION=+
MRIFRTASSIIVLSASSGDAFAPLSRSTNHKKRGIEQRPKTTSVTSTATTTSLSAYIATAENAPRNLAQLDDWATNAGIQKVEGLELYTEDGLDYQYITTADIPAGTTLMYIPAGVCLSSSAVEAELNAASNGGVAAAVDQLGRIGGQNSVADFYLFVKLLAEFEAQENSPYLPWLDSLPRLYYNSVSMTDFCYECLPPLVFSLSRLERVKFDNFREVLKKVDLVSDYVKNDIEVLKWAFNSVYTRAYADKEGQGSDVTVTPLGDMFNHGTETDIEVYFDEGGNAMVYTTADVAANSPLRISYGCPTNPSFLFARYGFLDESSPATFCKMMDIPKTPENVAMGMDFSKMLFYHDTGDISQEVMDVVLYAKVLANLKSSPETDGYKDAFYNAHIQGDEGTKAQIAEQFRYETLTEIKKHVDTFLESLVELEKKSYGKNFEEHPRLPLILRHNEFVKQTFQKVQSNLAAAGVGQMEYEYA